MRWLELTCCCLLVTSAAGWSYTGADGPSYWQDTYSDCGLSSQSPIDIDTDSVTLNDSLGAITFTNYDVAVNDYTLSNNGHSAQMTLTGDTVTISGGGLDGTYILRQFHFHWGNSSSMGSEHTINGTQYDAELHLVHYKDTYASLNDAVADAEALAVIGFLISIGGSDNAHYSDLVETLSNVTYTDSSADFGAVAVKSFLPDGTLPGFYRYNGSLTTPACYESVVWTLYKDPITLSSAQMTEFWSLVEETSGSADTPIENVYRPVQNLNGRVVYDSGSSSLFAHALTIALVPLAKMFSDMMIC